MTDTGEKLPNKTQEQEERHPLRHLRDEIDRVFDRFAGGHLYSEGDMKVGVFDEVEVRELEGKEREIVVATKAGTTYHRSDCRLITRIRETDRIDLEREEADAYGLMPCKICIHRKRRTRKT